MSWSQKHDACIDCGTTEKRHRARGLCHRCYTRYLYWKNPEKHRARQQSYYLLDPDANRIRQQKFRQNNPQKDAEYCARYRKKHKRAFGVCKSAKWKAGVEVVDSLLGRGVAVGRAVRRGIEWFVPIRWQSGNVIEVPTTSVKRTGVWGVAA